MLTCFIALSVQQGNILHTHIYTHIHTYTQNQKMYLTATLKNLNNMIEPQHHS